MHVEREFLETLGLAMGMHIRHVNKQTRVLLTYLGVCKRQRAQVRHDSDGNKNSKKNTIKREYCSPWYLRMPARAGAAWQQWPESAFRLQAPCDARWDKH
jgi:hypothetical protein